MFSPGSYFLIVCNLFFSGGKKGSKKWLAINLRRIALYWVAWNRMIERITEWREPVESVDLQEVCKRAFPQRDCVRQ